MKVCPHCFKDFDLQQFIQVNGEPGLCPYCDENIEINVLDIKELLDFFSDFISLYQSNEKGAPLFEVVQKDWDFFSNDIRSKILMDDILKELDIDIKSSIQSVTYLDEIIECVEFWEEFKDIIKWETRFLTNTERLEELHWNQLFKRTVLLKHPESLLRARLHKDEHELGFKPDEMGSPNQEEASAGRANAQGIPSLYLSRSLETTLYEVRGSYLDEVSVGTYEINKDCTLKIIDFTETVNLFAETEIPLVEQVKSTLLKRQISQDLSKPLRRYDSELEYIPTQFICEYIKYLYAADGIMFDSSLHEGGKNIVLFQENKVRCKSVQKHRITNVNIASEELSLE